MLTVDPVSEQDLDILYILQAQNAIGETNYTTSLSLTGTAPPPSQNNTGK